MLTRKGCRRKHLPMLEPLDYCYDEGADQRKYTGERAGEKERDGLDDEEGVEDGCKERRVNQNEE